MGRECRRVPANWEHPKDEQTGHYRPLHKGEDVLKLLKEWVERYELFLNGQHPDQEAMVECGCRTPSDWDGGPPDPSDYMPDWSEEEKTHYQMYETTSEGKPISPVFPTPEEVARWCTDNGASSFGSDTAPYEWWLNVAKGGMALVESKLASGVKLVFI